MNPEQEELLGQALLKLQRVLATQQERQQRTAQRVSLLYKVSLVSFGVLVLSMSFMIILMATQLPLLTGAINQMNTHFAAITADMEVMRRGMYAMQRNVDSLPLIVQNIDTMYSSTTQMRQDVGTMQQHLAQIRQDMHAMSANVTDMRQSFNVMDNSVTLMQHNVRHMSAPMRMFNSFNPLW